MEFVHITKKIYIFRKLLFIISSYNEDHLLLEMISFPSENPAMLYLILRLQNSSCSSINSVHFLTTTVVHCLLLFLQLTYPFTDRHTIRYRTWLCLTLTSMDLKESPYPFAYITPTRGLNLTLCPVLQKAFHFGTIGRWTLC